MNNYDINIIESINKVAISWTIEMLTNDYQHILYIFKFFYRKTDTKKVGEVSRYPLPALKHKPMRSDSNVIPTGSMKSIYLCK